MLMITLKYLEVPPEDQKQQNNVQSHSRKRRAAADYQNFVS